MVSSVSTSTAKPTYQVQVRILYPKIVDKRTGKPKSIKVFLRTVTIQTYPFLYKVFVRKGVHYVSRQCTHEQVAKGASTLLYGSTAVQSTSTVRMVRHCTLNHEEFVHWLTCALGNARAAHNCIGKLYSDTPTEQGDTDTNA